ncbi:MAG: tetratricopeptide repeat protein [Thermoanaerobaculaceae bacterium]|jgi:tetratricopeptide (TPR) repeat protein|nr:tetratricopeptide repeat protein [Thermoanaerobaculaceae bacterium]
MLTCPKCGRQVRPQPLCLYCGTRLQTTPVAILGMNGAQWLAEGARVLALAQRERAEKAVRNALQLDPTLDQAWLLLTRTLAELGRHGEARKALEEGVRANPGSAPLREALRVAETVTGTGGPILAARRLAEAGNHTAAVSTLDQVLRNPALRAAPESAVVLVLRVLLVTDAPVGGTLARELAAVNARLPLPAGQQAVEVVPL